MIKKVAIVVGDTKFEHSVLQNKLKKVMVQMNQGCLFEKRVVRKGYFFETRVVRKEFFAPLDDQDEGTSENAITMSTFKQPVQLEIIFSPSVTTFTDRKIPDDFSPHGLSEPSCMQLCLSNISLNAYSSPAISARHVSIASLEADVASPGDLSRSSIIIMDNLLKDLKQKQDEDAVTETKDAGSETNKFKNNHKKKKKKSKKETTSTEPCEAPIHHHGQDQDRAGPHDSSTGSTTNKPIWKVPKTFPSRAEQRRRRSHSDRIYSTGATTNEPLWKVPKSFPSPARRRSNNGRIYLKQKSFGRI